MTELRPIPEGDHQLAVERLDAGGFFDRTLDQMQLPELKRAPNGNKPYVPYVLIGNQEAPNVVLEGAPCLTDLDSPHYLLRLMAHQQALGEDYAVVGVQAYQPEDNGFDGGDLRNIGKGNFAPLSARMFRVTDALRLQDHQLVLPYGYSLAGDTAVQVAHDALYGENRGVIEVKAVGAFEFARSSRRGGIAVTAALAGSGNELFDNIVASGMPALNEAWGIKPSRSERANRRTVKGRVNTDVAAYVLHGTYSNIQLARGCGTDASIHQIKDMAEPEDILEATDAYVVAGRQSRSTVCVEGVDERLLAAQVMGTLNLLIEAGDHSADDNLRNSAARVLYFARQVTASGFRD